jgi:hypothetical protein
MEAREKNRLGLLPKKSQREWDELHRKCINIDSTRAPIGYLARGRSYGKMLK